MKKLFTLIAVALMTISANAQTTIYSWESPEGTVNETGGTIAYVNGDGDRLNYANSVYHTISLNGKKANLEDADASANAGHMVVTLNEGLKEGDKITITAYRNKNADGKAGSIYMKLGNGTVFDGVEGDLYWVNILSDDTDDDYDDDGSTPNSYTWTVPAAEEGSKTITMTRSASSTNVFIIKMVVTREGGSTPAGPTSTVEATYKSYSTDYPNYNDADWGMVEGAKFKVELYDDNDSIVIRNWMNQNVDLCMTYDNTGTIKSVCNPGGTPSYWAYASSSYYAYVACLAYNSSTSWYSKSSKAIFLKTSWGQTWDNYYLTWASADGLKAVSLDSATPSARKYVENGNVVIVKNGKKYNAVGAMLK